MPHNLIRLFSDPPRELGPTPFLALNDGLDPDRLRATLADFRDKGMAGVFMHARTGLEVPYLSETWWDRITAVVEECARLGLKAWIYDEYNWPSGVAGGAVIADRPDFLMPCLQWAEIGEKSKRKKWDRGRVLAAFLMGDRVEDLGEDIEDNAYEAPEDLSDRVLLFYEDKVTDNTFATKNAPWSGEAAGYVDIMNPEAAARFIELTHHEYARRMGEHFGKTIPGVFTDEPQFYRGYPYSERLREAFRERHGQDPIGRAYLLKEDREGFRTFRCRYYALAEELFAESFMKPMRRFCDDHGLILTGHLGMEENLSNMASNHGGLYRPLKHMTMPGIDALGKGNPIRGGLVNMECPRLAPALASSISRLFGDGRALCETGGGSGWSVSPSELKTQLDWLLTSGITFINPHQSLLSVKGLRKRDFPPSHNCQEPWFDHYKIFSDYVARMSAMASAGTAASGVGIVLPESSLRAFHRGREAQAGNDLASVVTPFSSLLEFLCQHQRCFDLVFEGAAEDGLIKVGDGKLLQGGRAIELLLVPPAPVMASALALAIRDYLAAGGKAIVFETLPAEDQDGNDLTETLLPVFRAATREGRALQLSSKSGFTKSGLAAALGRLLPPAIRVESDSREQVNHLHRIDGDTSIHILANLGTDRALGSAVFRTAPVTLTALYPDTGKIRPVPWRPHGGDGAEVDLDLGPGEAVALVADNNAGEAGPAPSVTRTNLELTDIGPDRVAGVAAAEEAVVYIGGDIHKQSGTPLPPVLRLDPEWAMAPASPNTCLVEPWRVSTKRRKPAPLSEMRGEYRFTGRTAQLIIAGRRAVRALEAIGLPLKGYRTERYFDFEEAERMKGPMGKATGIDLERWGLYEGAEAMEKLAALLGINAFMRTFPPPGEEYAARATVKIARVPKEASLIYEDLGEPVGFEINGVSVKGEPVAADAWDPCCRSLDVTGYLRRGRNKIVMRGRQLPYEAYPPPVHSIEPVVLSGPFSVRDGIIDEPDYEARRGAWFHERGLPCYSGLVSFHASISLSEKYPGLDLRLEIDELCEAAEVLVNGVSAGARMFPPFRYDISELVKFGRNNLEVRVANTAGNLLGHPAPSGWSGEVRVIPRNRFEVDLGGGDGND